MHTERCHSNYLPKHPAIFHPPHSSSQTSRFSQPITTSGIHPAAGRYYRGSIRILLYKSLKVVKLQLLRVTEALVVNGKVARHSPIPLRAVYAVSSYIAIHFIGVLYISAAALHSTFHHADDLNGDGFFMIILILPRMISTGAAQPACNHRCYCGVRGYTGGRTIQLNC